MSYLSKEEIKKQMGDWVKLIPYSFVKKALSTIESTEKNLNEVYPSKENIFRAFNLCQFKDLKVIIIGQDPFHTPDVANGLAFSINPTKTKKVPPSLLRILKEAKDDVGAEEQYDLSHWAKQGVLLLNTALTVKKSTPESHLLVWIKFTETLLKNISDYHSGIIYILWGKKAQYFKQFINEDTNYILEAGHPSPLNSRNNFLGCKHFSKVNEILKKQDLKTIEW